MRRSASIDVTYNRCWAGQQPTESSVPISRNMFHMRDTGLVVMARTRRWRYTYQTTLIPSGPIHLAQPRKDIPLFGVTTFYGLALAFSLWHLQGLRDTYQPFTSGYCACLGAL